MVYLLLAVGLLFLIYGGDLLVRGAVQLARRIGVSPLLIGLTLVGFGTSTPELVTSLIAVFKQSEGIAVGNVVGSNIANILLVLGAAAVISPVQVDTKSFKRDSVFLIISTLGILIALAFGQISFILGSILTGLLIVYVVYSYISDKKNQKAIKNQEAELAELTNSTEIKGSFWIPLAKTFIGIALTLGGAKLLVDNAIILARTWGISEAVIGLTLVAVGTSLPELATSVMSAIRHQDDVAFGNVVGSNIYNALFILGITAIFMPILIPQTMSKDIWIMTAVTAALIGIAFWKKQFSRSIGVLFLLVYTLYTYTLFAG